MKRFLAIAILLATSFGCDNGSSTNTSTTGNSSPASVGNAPEPSSTTGQSTTSDSTAAASAAAQPTGQASSLVNDVEITLADIARVQSAVQSYKGRVVVLDVWSTSCLPCMKEFPHLVELSRRWPEDVVAISLNADYIGLPNKPAKDCLPKAREFLVSVSANPTNLMNLLCSESDETIYAKFEIEALPAILVYDREGNLAKKITIDTAGDDGLSYAGDVVPLVEKLVESR